MREIEEGGEEIRRRERKAHNSPACEEESMDSKSHGKERSGLLKVKSGDCRLSA